MCVGFVTLTFTLDFHTFCTQNPKTTFDRVLSNVQREVGAKFCWSGVMKIYAGFFSLIIIIADTILSTVAALWVMAKRTKRN